MDDLKTYCCQNEKCPDYGRRGLDNLRVCFRNGPDNERRVLAYRTCQKRFSERKGTALYRCQLPEHKAVAVLQHLQESCGVRQTSRLVGVNKNTVVRLAVVAGQHAQECHDELVAFSPKDSGSAVRREVVVRRQKGKALVRTLAQPKGANASGPTFLGRTAHGFDFLGYRCGAGRAWSARVIS